DDEMCEPVCGSIERSRSREQDDLAPGMVETARQGDEDGAGEHRHGKQSQSERCRRTKTHAAAEYGSIDGGDPRPVPVDQLWTPLHRGDRAPEAERPRAPRPPRPHLALP